MQNLVTARSSYYISQGVATQATMVHHTAQYDMDHSNLNRNRTAATHGITDYFIVLYFAQSVKKY